MEVLTKGDEPIARVYFNNDAHEPPRLPSGKQHAVGGGLHCAKIRIVAPAAAAPGFTMSNSPRFAGIASVDAERVATEKMRLGMLSDRRLASGAVPSLRRRGGGPKKQRATGGSIFDRLHAGSTTSSSNEVKRAATSGRRFRAQPRAGKKPNPAVRPTTPLRATRRSRHAEYSLT